MIKYTCKECSKEITRVEPLEEIKIYCNAKKKFVRLTKSGNCIDKK